MVTRTERVRLELEDNFTTGMAKAAATTALLNHELNSLSGSAVTTSRDLNRTSQDIDRTGAAADRNGKQIDRLSGRLALLAQAASVLAPALVPIGAAALPAVAGLTAGVGALAGAVGVSVLALNGMGDAIKALNTYELEPTAENLQAMRVEMEKLGPEGAHFVRFIDHLEPQLRSLQMAAREGLLPGVEEGITSLLDKLPQVRRIVSEMAGAMGELAADAGADLSGPRWREFFTYLDREAAPTLESMGHTIGNFASGLAQMLADFAPLSAQFAGGLEAISSRFANWAAGLDQSADFQEFLAYVAQSGPKVIDLLGSLAQTLASIVRAAAPVGDLVLPILTAMVEVLGAIADSQIGPVLFTAAAAFSVYSRAAAIATVATEKLEYAQARLGRNNVGGWAKTAAAGLGMIGLSLTDLDERAGLSNTAMLGLAGSMAGPWGAAAGSAIGLTMDLAAANDDLEAAITRANLALGANSMPDIRRAYADLRHDLNNTKDDYEAFDDVLDGHLSRLPAALRGIGAQLAGGTREGERALADLETRMTNGAGLAAIYGDVIGRTGRQIQVAAGNAEEFSRALSILEGWLDKRAALRNYEQSIDDLRDSLHEHAAAWDRDTQAGRDNLELLDTTATAIAQVASKMKSPEARADFLQNARKQLLDLAHASPETAAAVQQVIDKLDAVGLTHPKARVETDTRGAQRDLDAVMSALDGIDGRRPKPRVDADTRGADEAVNSTQELLSILTGKPYVARVTADAQKAFSTIDAVQFALGQLHDKTVTINTVHRESYLNKVSGIPAPGEHAGGGLISGPGGPTDDLIPAWLSNREYVVRAAAVEKYGVGFFDAVNALNFAVGGPASRDAYTLASGGVVTTIRPTVLPDHVPGAAA